MGGVNRPIMSMVAPTRGVASLMAVKLSLVHLFSALVSSPAIYAFSYAFGYHSSRKHVKTMDPERRAQNVAALANMMVVAGTVGFFFCFVCYTAMQFSYKRDLADKEEATKLEE